MLWHVCWLGLVFADGSDEGPVIVPASAAVSRELPVAPKGPTNDGQTPLSDLRRELAKLRGDREAMGMERGDLADQTKAAESPSPDEAARLRRRVGELMIKLAQPAPVAKSATKAGSSATSGTPAAMNSTPVSPTAPTEASADGQAFPPLAVEPGKPVDPLGLAQALFQAGDFQGALEAYRLLELNGLRGEERVTVQYLVATCLRRLNKPDEAANLFREVANSKGDPMMVECAQWQLDAIEWRRKLEAQLEQLRQRRKALEGKP